ncbi:MAG: hypothetical protein AAFO02_15240, partial [Bacteroidota bacterium]
WGARHGNNVFTKPAEYAELLLDFVGDFVPEWPVCSTEEGDSIESPPTSEDTVDERVESE